MTRRMVLKSGAALALAGALPGALPGFASAAALPEEDLAYLRLLVGVELLTLDFSSSHSGYEQMHADDSAHYAGLATLLATSGVVAATSGDVDFSYPKKAKTAELAWTLKALAVGAYAGALENVSTPALRLPLAQILVNESQQLSSLAQPVGKPAVGRPFGDALTIAAVTSALDEYES